MKNYKVLFCDLDGTLIKTKSGETFPKGVWDMELRFEVLDAIKKLNPEFIGIVSNQGGIEKGFVDTKAFIRKSDYISYSVEEYCKSKCVSAFCRTNDPNNEDRKPNTGMLKFLSDLFVTRFDKKTALMIGDASGKEGQWSDTDKKTAENFGIDYLDVEDFVKQYK